MTRTHKMIAVDYKNLVQELPIFLATDLTNWEYIDDRYNSFYGSTFEITVEDYKTDENFKNKIVIIGDNYLIEDKYTYNTNYITDIYSTYIPINKTREYETKSFQKVLSYVYPNAVIERVSGANLDDVISYLTSNVDNLPNYLIFNGAESTFVTTENSSDVITKLTIINQICQSNDIKSLLIYTPKRDIIDLGSNDWYNVFPYQYTNIEILDLWRWLENHLELDNALTWANIQNKVSSMTDDKNPCISENGYSQIIHNRIKKAVINDFFDLHRKHFYISFQYTKVTKDTYKNAVQYKKDTYESHIFGRKYTGNESDDKCLSTELDQFQTIHTPEDVQAHFITKYGTDNNWNMFCNTGEFIAIGIHTSYAEDKFMCQQLQVNCNEEYQYSRGDYINLMKIRKYFTGAVTSEGTPIVPPMFPATGCPWICVSDDNIEKYGVQLYRSIHVSIGDISTKSIRKSPTKSVRKAKSESYRLEKYLPRYCYITQTDKSITLSIELNDCNGKRPTLWQSASVGMVDDLQAENYPFPLYACGGSQGIKQDLYKYTPTHGNCYTHLEGNVYDLSADNICLSNSNALHPTKFYNSNSSTFKVLSPEGKWYNIFNRRQDAKVVGLSNCGGCTPDFKCVMEEPYGYVSSSHRLYPEINHKKKTTTFKEMHDEEPYLEKTHPTQISKLSIYLNKSLNHGETEIIGEIPLHYSCYDESMPCGEVFINDKRYLCLPNVWDWRLWYYEYVYGYENNKWTQEYVRNRFDKIFMPKRYERINDKLLIRLED